MKIIGNLLAIIGILLFAYTIVAKVIGFDKVVGFVGGPGILGLTFKPLGVLGGAACVLIIAVIFLLNAKK